MMQLTEDLARAASKDAGNMSMRNAGRKSWNEDDWNASVAEFERLWPAPVSDERCEDLYNYCADCGTTLDPLDTTSFAGITYCDGCNAKYFAPQKIEAPAPVGDVITVTLGQTDHPVGYEFNTQTDHCVVLSKEFSPDNGYRKGFWWYKISRTPLAPQTPADAKKEPLARIRRNASARSNTEARTANFLDYVHSGRSRETA